MQNIGRLLEKKCKSWSLIDVSHFILDDNFSPCIWNNEEQYDFYFYYNDKCKVITIAKWNNKFWYYFEGHSLNQLTKATLQSHNYNIMISNYRLRYVSAPRIDEYTDLKFTILKPYCNNTQNIYISYIPFSESIIADLKLSGYVNTYEKDKKEIFQLYYKIGYRLSEMDDRYVYTCTIKQNEDYF